jgi:hypothetical protein
MNYAMLNGHDSRLMAALLSSFGGVLQKHVEFFDI